MNQTQSRGQMLMGATVLVGILLIFVPLMVQWSRQEARWAVKEQHAVVGFNIAEAAVDRGLWKLKSTTTTWRRAVDGQVIAGYNFDVTHTDIDNGSYRLRFTAGPGAEQVTVLAEGRDNRTRQTRAIRAIYESNALPGPLLTSGQVTYAGSLECHWGPIMANNNILISGNAATEFFPRKFSRQLVSGTALNPRDLNGLNPPNTNNTEWWSDYPVPDLPLLDFVTMRSSSVANGTLNYYTTSGASGSGKCIGWAGHGRCMSAANNWAAHQNKPHFFDSNNHPKSKQNLIWYYDNDLVLTGNMDSGGCFRLGLYGVLIVRGSLTVDAGDCYAYTGPVPAGAWKEYTKIKVGTNDTTTTNQYPADNGLRTSRTTFRHGVETWTGGPPAANTDVGLRGFIYSGGHLTFNSIADVAGTIWAVGNVINNDVTERVLVFYEGSNPNVPVLNVVLNRVSWDEVTPTAGVW